MHALRLWPKRVSKLASVAAEALRRTTANFTPQTVGRRAIGRPHRDTLAAKVCKDSDCYGSTGMAHVIHAMFYCAIAFLRRTSFFCLFVFLPSGRRRFKVRFLQTENKTNSSERAQLFSPKIFIFDVAYKFLISYDSHPNGMPPKIGDA